MTATILNFPAMEQLPNRIRELRKARGWTLEQLAHRLDCGITMVSDLERGHMRLSLPWMQRIARAFKVQPGDLLLASDNSSALSPDQRELLDLYALGDDHQRAQLLSIARTLVSPAGVAPTKVA